MEEFATVKVLYIVMAVIKGSMDPAPLWFWRLAYSVMNTFLTSRSRASLSVFFNVTSSFLKKSLTEQYDRYQVEHRCVWQLKVNSTKWKSASCTLSDSSTYTKQKCIILLLIMFDACIVKMITNSCNSRTTWVPMWFQGVVLHTEVIETCAKGVFQYVRNLDMFVSVDRSYKKGASTWTACSTQSPNTTTTRAPKRTCSLRGNHFRRIHTLVWELHVEVVIAQIERSVIPRSKERLRGFEQADRMMLSGPVRFVLFRVSETKQEN